MSKRYKGIDIKYDKKKNPTVNNTFPTEGFMCLINFIDAVKNLSKISPNKLYVN